MTYNKNIGGPLTNAKNRLQKLSGSDFEIADGQEDIRNWTVKDYAGQKLGEVDELIFDEASRKVRYIVLDMDDNDLNMDDRKVMVPIGLAVLHERDDEVILRTVTVDQLRSLPEYDEDNFDPDTEKRIFNVFDGSRTLKTESDFYSHEYFDDGMLYRNRQKPL